MMTAPVKIIPPSGSWIPVVASLPHSGVYVPPDIARLCTPLHLSTLRNTDWHLQDLYDFLPDMGIHTVCADFSRYVIDPNRALKEPLFGPYKHSAVYETDTWGETIYHTLPTEENCRARIGKYYAPYHDALQKTLDTIRQACGRVYLIDLHSFMGPISEDVCLGNKNGAVPSAALVPLLRKRFTDAGYNVAVNKVFTGGHIIEHYGMQPHTEAIQIELRYSTYLPAGRLDKDTPPEQEETLFGQAKARLQNIFHACLDLSSAASRCSAINQL